MENQVVVGQGCLASLLPSFPARGNIEMLRLQSLMHSPYVDLKIAAR